MSGIVGSAGSRSGIIGRSKDTAKAWTKFNASSFAQEDDFNVSTVADESNEVHKINFITPMANDNYAYVMNSESGDSAHLRFCVTNQVNVAYLRIQGKYKIEDTAIANSGNNNVSVLIFGD